MIQTILSVNFQISKSITYEKLLFFSHFSLPFQKIVVTLQPILKIVFYMILENGKLGIFSISKIKSLAGMRANLFVNVGFLVPPMRITLSPFFLQKNPANLENLNKIPVQTKKKCNFAK